jgi:D-3-phosphoglycerate dehydrogenase / 2-oxoglutarate reductase
VILTPHIGGSTEEAQSDIGGFVANKLVSFLEDGNTTLSVNLPGVALPEQTGTSRIVHVHINTPGVLAKVNSILADHSVNVEGQLLSTRGEYGYLITDIGGGFSDEVLDSLRAMEQTVRLRVLS